MAQFLLNQDRPLQLFLAHHLKKYAENKTLKNHLVFDVKTKDEKVIATVFDAEKNVTIEVIANKVIMATPQFVNQYIIFVMAI